jgi:hypothetical protein
MPSVKDKKGLLGSCSWRMLRVCTIELIPKQWGLDWCYGFAALYHVIYHFGACIFDEQTWPRITEDLNNGFKSST